MIARPKLTLNWRGKCAPVPDICFVDATCLEDAPVPSVQVALKVDPWTPPAPLDLCLELWKTWMHGDGDRDLGTKAMGGLMGDTDGHGIDVHEQQQAADMRIAMATDAMIESMDRIHIWAIYKLCSIANPWRFPNADILVVGEEARQVLFRKLKKNVCTAVLF
jgi:hypothetical protein